ncbi:unnamed protein product [Closterium sp. NIES-53]
MSLALCLACPASCPVLPSHHHCLLFPTTSTSTSPLLSLSRLSRAYLSPSYPLQLYPWEVKANPYTHKRYKDAPQVFTGDNTAKALVSFATASPLVSILFPAPCLSSSYPASPRTLLTLSSRTAIRNSYWRAHGVFMPSNPFVPHHFNVPIALQRFSLPTSPSSSPRLPPTPLPSHPVRSALHQPPYHMTWWSTSLLAPLLTPSHPLASPILSRTSCHVNCCALPALPPAALPHDLVVNISSGASADAFLAANATLNKVPLLPPCYPSRPLLSYVSCPPLPLLHLLTPLPLPLPQHRSQSTQTPHPPLPTSSQQADGTRQIYEGPLKPEPIAAFLEQFAAPAEPAADSATAGGADAGGAGAAGEESQARWVRQMRAANVSSQVLQREEMWMVALTSSAGERDVVVSGALSLGAKVKMMALGPSAAEMCMHFLTLSLSHSLTFSLPRLCATPLCHASVTLSPAECGAEECREVKEKFEKTAEELVGMVRHGKAWLSLSSLPPHSSPFLPLPPPCLHGRSLWEWWTCTRMRMPRGKAIESLCLPCSHATLSLSCRPADYLECSLAPAAAALCSSSPSQSLPFLPSCPSSSLPPPSTPPSLASKYGVKEPCGEALLFPLGDDKEENEPDVSSHAGNDDTVR